jgi:hypothetical protein
VNKVKPKTQMRIGLWGAINLLIIGFCYFINTFSFSIKSFIAMACLSLWLIYIFSIFRKKLSAARIVFDISWKIYGILSIVSIVLVFLKSPMLRDVLPAILIAGISFGIYMSIMWMGLRGLQRTIESESLFDNTHLQQKSQLNDLINGLSPVVLRRNNKLEPETKMKIGLWGTIVLFIMFGCILLSQSMMSDKVFDYIFLIIFFCYIMGITYRKLDLALISYRVFWVFFAVLFVCFIIAEFSKTLFTVFGFLVLMVIFLAFNAISITIMLTGIKGLRQIIKVETESQLNEQQTSTAEKVGEL